MTTQSLTVSVNEINEQIAQMLKTASIIESECD